MKNFKLLLAALAVLNVTSAWADAPSPDEETVFDPSDFCSDERFENCRMSLACGDDSLTEDEIVERKLDIYNKWLECDRKDSCEWDNGACAPASAHTMTRQSGPSDHTTTVVQVSRGGSNTPRLDDVETAIARLKGELEDVKASIPEDCECEESAEQKQLREDLLALKGDLERKLKELEEQKDGLDPREVEQDRRTAVLGSKAEDHESRISDLESFLADFTVLNVLIGGELHGQQGLLTNGRTSRGSLAGLFIAEMDFGMKLDQHWRILATGGVGYSYESRAFGDGDGSMARGGARVEYRLDNWYFGIGPTFERRISGDRPDGTVAAIVDTYGGSLAVSYLVFDHVMVRLSGHLGAENGGSRNLRGDHIGVNGLVGGVSLSFGFSTDTRADSDDEDEGEEEAASDPLVPKD